MGGDIENHEDSQKVPLLHPPDAISYEDCPGCKVERKKFHANGAPKKELFLVGILILSNVLPISSIFPYIYFLTKSFDIVKSDKDIGFYAGFLGSSFMFGRFFTSTLWGVIADRYGRKPVFIITTLEIVIFNTWFGFSRGFWTAITSRFLLGCFHGSIGPVRAYASEICDQEHQALALSLVGTVWSVGLIIGPALGGYLSQPSTKYPNIFPEGSLFDKFPFLLPPLTISAIAVVASFISFTILESLHNHPTQVNTSEPKIVDVKVSEFENTSDKESTTKKDGKAGDINLLEQQNPSILKNKGMWASISVFCLWSLHDVAYSEIFCLWAVSPREYDGLGFSTSDVGTILSITGAFLLVFQLLLFPPLEHIFGAINMTRAPAILTLPLLLVYPPIKRLNGVFLWIAIISASVVKNILSTCISTGLFMLINNSVIPKQRGLANGISMSGMSLFRAIGPASAGIVFSWSQKRLNTSFLPGNWMLFIILDAVCLIAVISMIDPIMPRSLEHPKEMQIYKEEKPILKHSASFLD